MFEMLDNELIKEYDKEMPKGMLTVEQAMRESTDKRYEQYQNGEITEEQFCLYATNRLHKRLLRELERDEQKLDAIYNTPGAKEINIALEATKRRMTATVTVTDVNNHVNEYKGYGVGYGIDRSSCAVADALNQSYAVLHDMYQCKENGLKTLNRDDNEKSNMHEDNEKFLGYGSGYESLPRFEQGVGVTCFWIIFRSMGFKVKEIFFNDSFDVYYIEKDQDN